MQTSAHASGGRRGVRSSTTCRRQERDAASERRAARPAGVLQPPPPIGRSNAGIAFIGVLLLYGQLFGYGLWVATGVIEEKASRVVEMLLSAIRPRQLLAGKIIGIGALGLAPARS